MSSITDNFKKYYSIETIAICNRDEMRNLGIDWTNAKEISIGPKTGNWFRDSDWYIYTPASEDAGSYFVCFFSKKHYSTSSLNEILYFLYKIKDLADIEKSCWECGQKFIFSKLSGSFKKRLDNYIDEFCGCD